MAFIQKTKNTTFPKNVTISAENKNNNYTRYTGSTSQNKLNKNLLSNLNKNEGKLLNKEDSCLLGMMLSEQNDSVTKNLNNSAFTTNKKTNSPTVSAFISNKRRKSENKEDKELELFEKKVKKTNFL